jgi:hypothetical protein
MASLLDNKLFKLFCGNSNPQQGVGLKDESLVGGQIIGDRGQAGRFGMK